MQQFVDSFGLVYSLRLLPALLRIVTLLVFGLFTLKLLDTALKRVMRIVPPGDSARHRVEKRAETLRHVVRSFGNGLLAVVVILQATSELGYDMGPLLAGAGIAGLAIGFGAQSLVKDVIAGFFVLLEDQYGVGDVVRIGQDEGTVEEMSLRVTVLRSGEGEVHVIPNGNIQSVTVLTKDWRRAIIRIPVSRKEELGRVFDVLSRVGELLDKDMAAALLDKPAVAGVEKLTGNTVWIQVNVKTLPAKHGEVVLEWRRRIKVAFDKEGIELASDGLEQLSGR